MPFVVSNDIRLSPVDRTVERWCREHLTIKNPEYEKKVRLGKWIGNTPKELFLYEVNGDELIIPFGCLKELYKEFSNRIQFLPVFKPIDRTFYNSTIKLYGYQENAVLDALRARNGVIVMPCGAGKTQTALELISRLGGRTLWLTHTQDLLNQSLNRAKSCFDVDNSFFGTITGGKVNIRQITFATVQTMCKLDLEKYKNAFDVVVVDECHKCVGTPTRVMQFYKVLSSLACRYKFGLTATPKRNDGLVSSMFSLLGDIICEVDKSEVANTTCPIRVVFKKTGFQPDLDVVLSGDGTINYSALVDDMIRDKDRFKTVLDTVNECKGYPTLILANRVEYVQRLSDASAGKSICLSTIGNSKRSKEERKDALRKLNNGEIDFVFATYQLAKEGLDVPNLRYVILATPEKDETTVIQSAGRVGRKAEGKEYGTVIDFVDDFGMYKGWSKKRLSYYKKLNYMLTN